MQNRTSFLLAATIAALTTAAGAARAEVPCWPAIDVVASTLPELVAQEARHTWRGLPVEFECRGREVGSITVRWGAAAGTLSDARSAIAALGSHLTADTSTAVRGALDRCIQAAGKGNGTQRTTSSRSAIACDVRPDGATLSVRRRGPEE